MMNQPLVRWVDLGLDPTISLGFTSRSGGFSDGDWGGLNLGFHVADDPATVARNRQLLATELGVPVVWMDQVHGSHIADARHAQIDDNGFLNVGQADGIIIERPVIGDGLAAAVMVADCIPLLIADRTGQRGAVVHVGRAGMDKNIAGAAVAQLVARGSAVTDLRAVLGPSICGSCYEVSPELAADVGMRHPQALSQTRFGTPGLDIRSGLLSQLDGLGVAAVDDDICTYETTGYYSFRRSTHERSHSGRFVGIVRLLAKTHRAK
ncbi:MAG: laccase domain-containing protein [Actinomycetaceae bacterium]|nr:laccase domain-containing protein [Actinomycetaceae bacterium]